MEAAEATAAVVEVGHEAVASGLRPEKARQARHEPLGQRVRVQGKIAAVTWQAFLRHVQEGEPALQVAEALGLSVNSVLLAKSRVLKRLRQEAAGLVT